MLSIRASFSFHSTALANARLDRVNDQRGKTVAVTAVAVIEARRSVDKPLSFVPCLCMKIAFLIPPLLQPHLKPDDHEHFRQRPVVVNDLVARSGVIGRAGTTDLYCPLLFRVREELVRHSTAKEAPGRNNSKHMLAAFRASSGSRCSQTCSASKRLMLFGRNRSSQSDRFVRLSSSSCVRIHPR